MIYSKLKTHVNNPLESYINTTRKEANSMGKNTTTLDKANLSHLRRVIIAVHSIYRRRLIKCRLVQTCSVFKRQMNVV